MCIPLRHRALAFGVVKSALGMSSSAKIESPSAQRNKGPIWDVLKANVLPKLSSSPESKLSVLEIATGCGVHTEHFAKRISKARGVKLYIPTDPHGPSRASLQAYLDEDEELRSVVSSPLELLLTETGSSPEMTTKALDGKQFDLITCINMIHISPWTATIGLMKLSQEKLRPGGILYCYGAYKVGGTAVESNL